MTGPRVSLLIARLEADNLDSWTRAAQRWLSEEENSRATRMAAGPRARHVVGRALIRLVVAAEADLEPAEVSLATAETGKPVVVAPPELEISVAHTAEVVVVGWCHGVAIGVDVESLTRSNLGPNDGIAARFFAPTEAQALAKLRIDSPDDFTRAFLRHWTIKEAVGKAIGEGIGPALAGAIVELPATGKACLTSVWTAPAPSEWTLHELTAGGDHQELIAVALPQPGAILGDVHAVGLSELVSGKVLPA